LNTNTLTTNPSHNHSEQRSVNREDQERTLFS